jgi:hypothetical protein
MNQPLTLADVVNPLWSLSDEIETLKREVAKGAGLSHDKSQDARLVALSAIQKSLLVFGFWEAAGTNLKGIIQSTKGPNWEKDYRSALGIGPGLLPGDPNPVQTIENMMATYLLNALSVSIHFQVDNLFANLLRGLGETPGKTFAANSTAILNSVGLPTSGIELDTLRALASLRNSFHNNGIHRGEDLSITLDGQKFEFKKGQPIQYSLPHLVALLKANVKVVSHILKSSRVSALKHPVSDDFASRLEWTGP